MLIYSLMGSATLKPTIVRFSVPPGKGDLFEQFNKIRIIKGLKKSDAYTSVIENYVKANQSLFNTRWVGWDELEKALAKAGYSINRVTMWKYRNERPEFKELSKSDGTDVLWDLDGILRFYQK